MSPSELNGLDRIFLDRLEARHPRSCITVLRGFFDGTDEKRFGSVPHDWDGSHVVYEFRLVPRSPLFSRPATTLPR